MSERIPIADSALVNHMAKLFPDRCPNETDSERQVWMSVGAAKVVRKLRQISEAQSNKLFERDVSGDD